MLQLEGVGGEGKAMGGLTRGRGLEHYELG